MYITVLISGLARFFQHSSLTKACGYSAFATVARSAALVTHASNAMKQWDWARIVRCTVVHPQTAGTVPNRTRFTIIVRCELAFTFPSRFASSILRIRSLIQGRALRPRTPLISCGISRISTFPIPPSILSNSLLKALSPSSFSLFTSFFPGFVEQDQVEHDDTSRLFRGSVEFAKRISVVLLHGSPPYHSKLSRNILAPMRSTINLSKRPTIDLPPSSL